MSRMAKPFLALVLVLVPATAARGEEPPADPRPGLDRELAETVERFMVQRFARFLELGPEQREIVLPLVRERTRARRLHARQRREAIRTLAAMSQDSGVDEPMLRRRLEAFYREDEEFHELERRTNREIRARLDVRQEARLLAFEERFREEMRRRLEAARRNPGRPPRRPRR